LGARSRWFESSRPDTTHPPVKPRLFCNQSLRSILCSLVFSCVAAAQTQYLVINIAPEENRRAAFQEIVAVKERNRSAEVRLGIGAIFSYLRQPREEVRADLTEFLEMAKRYDIPVIVQLDGEQWWEGRPELWNWWNPARPGYDPRNRNNVEWSGWGPEHALKIAWRNWGVQMRVLPPPNLMSPHYRAACHEEMNTLVPLIVDWWMDLPSGKKDLLIGLKLGWESSIGVNAYYYPGGNRLLDSAAARDPKVELKGEEVPGRGVMPIGYASVSSAGLADSGALQEAHLAEVVRRHLDDLCALASRLGVPRERLFTHVGGWKEEELLYRAALNPYSCPGWSFYRHAEDPSKDAGVHKSVGLSNAPWWAAAEWFWLGEHDRDAWLEALRATLALPHLRYMCIYNWGGIRNTPALLEAIHVMLAGR
jgi:hypothetical protein